MRLAAGNENERRHLLPLIDALAARGIRPHEVWADRGYDSAALVRALRERKMTKTAFARLIGRDEKEARRILDPKHATKLATLSEALHALGKRLRIEFVERRVRRSA